MNAKSKEDVDKLLLSKRSNVIDNAKVNTMKKELNKKLTFKERILSKVLSGTGIQEWISIQECF